MGRLACLLAATLSTAGRAAVAPEAQAAEPSTPLVRIPFPQEDGSLTPYTFELATGS